MFLFFCFFHRVEQSVYALLRTRDMAISRYKEFRIPVDWLSDSGVVGKVKRFVLLTLKKTLFFSVFCKTILKNALFLFITDQAFISPAREEVHETSSL